jgi:methylated-DNA-[protein]-cysteine S-methyltransferase
MTKNYSYTYHLIPSTIGDIGVVRRAGRKSLQRILLPRQGRSMSELIREAFTGAVQEKTSRDTICMQLRAFLGGKSVDFSIGELDLDCVGEFAQRVFLADREIPRGRVMTYGRLAAKLGLPGGARAVGNALAGNPFPLVIPCHRVVRSDGSLGGFGGGTDMKKALLMMEGVVFDPQGRILPEYIL